MFGIMSASEETISGRRLAFPGKQQVQTEPLELPPLQEGKILTKTSFSLISTGADRIVSHEFLSAGDPLDALENTFRDCVAATDRTV